jgi:hypothetical protein
MNNGKLQLILIAILFIIAGFIDPCGDGGCTAQEERAANAKR